MSQSDDEGAQALVPPVLTLALQLTRSPNRVRLPSHLHALAFIAQSLQEG